MRHNGPRITGEGLRGTTMNDSDTARAGQLRSGQTDPPFVRCMRLLMPPLAPFIYPEVQSCVRKKALHAREAAKPLRFNLRPDEPAYVRGL